MKLLLSLLALGLVSGGTVSQAAEPADFALLAAKKQQAAKFAKDLPGTLVVRRDSAGNVAIYHSPKTLPAGQRLNYDPRFQQDFATREVPVSGLTAAWGYRGLGGLGGLFNFFWNVADAYSAPTYNYYNPGYNYSYNYGYSPYYNYYDPYGYSYSYYRWF
jgi:hypothetical protein